MNARIRKAVNDTREMPIGKPLEPLPAIFSTYGRIGFSTTRRARGKDPQGEVSAEQMRMDSGRVPKTIGDQTTGQARP
jgi:hypothetical protein